MRVDYVDAAKAASIVLVVYTHVVTREFWLNQDLVFLRMPLFFFVSGIFAAKAMGMSWKDFLFRKFGHLMYLYVVWAVILLLATTSVYRVLKGKDLNLAPLLELFTRPPETIWFVYALAIAFLIARLTRSLPAWLVVGAAGIAYAVDVALGNWLGFSFDEKLARLLVFFLAAVRFGPVILGLVPRLSRYWPVPLLLYLPLAHLANGTVLGHPAPFTLVTSASGILGLMAVFHRFADTVAVQKVSHLGKQTFFIYVMHRIPLYYMFLVTGYLGVIETARSPLMGVLVTAALCWLCLFVGNRIVRPYFGFLEAPFWLSPAGSSRRLRLLPSLRAN